MNTHETLRDVENLRFRVQMNNRLRLECLAAVSKVFREFEEPINDELLSSVIFALPQELISGNGHGKAQPVIAQEKGNPPEEPQKPGLPPQPKPSLPPQEPEREAPGLPPTAPVGLPPTAPVGLPPTSPEREAPALPPTA